ENQGKLKALQVNQDKGCVSPSAATVENGTYPLARPLFIYVAKTAADKPEVKAFVDFYTANAAKLSADVGYVKFPDKIYTQVSARWNARKVGTMYKDTPSGTPLDQLLSKP
ncbi:MAG TPA: substrate-binding domain-containing protein, partial [Dehalococcoidia bacterium]|nr:substrate-binding domain-containing protein [Dehalococcoidia bacterium]